MFHQISLCPVCNGNLAFGDVRRDTDFADDYVPRVGPFLTSIVGVLPERLRTDEAQLHRLADGRELAYLEWGEATGYPAFYFHGTPSSRLEGVFADGAAKRNGFRLIAVDRPGFGRSTFQPGRRFREWPADVCDLADALGLREFGVVGHSGAGPHLFVCGALIPPTRLRFIGAFAPWGPLATPEIVSALNATDRVYSALANLGAWTFDAAFVPLGWCAKYRPGLFCRLLTAWVPSAERQHLGDELFLRHFLATQLEGFRQGGRAGGYESFLLYRPWGFEVSEVAVPTHIWQGDRDSFVPSAMGHYFERTIPGVELNWSEGEDHFNVEDWDAILAACAADL